MCIIYLSQTLSLYRTHIKNLNETWPTLWPYLLSRCKDYILFDLDLFSYLFFSQYEGFFISFLIYFFIFFIFFFCQPNFWEILSQIPSLFQALGQWGRSPENVGRRRAGHGRDRARRPVFSIFPSDREPVITSKSPSYINKSGNYLGFGLGFTLVKHWPVSVIDEKRSYLQSGVNLISDQNNLTLTLT